MRSTAGTAFPDSRESLDLIMASRSKGILVETTDGPGGNAVPESILRNSLPVEDREASEVARLMLAPFTNPSADAIKQVYDSHLAADRIGYDRIGYALIDLLSDPDPLVQSGAAVKLLELGRGRENALQTLQRLLTSDKPGADDPRIKATTALSILKRVPEELHKPLDDLLHSKHRGLQLTAAALRTGSPEAIRILRKGLEEKEPGLVLIAAKALVRNKIAIEHAVRKMISIIGTSSDLFDATFIGVLSEVKEMVEVIGPVFVRVLRNANTTSFVRTVTASAIGKIGYASAAKDEFEKATICFAQIGGLGDGVRLVDGPEGSGKRVTAGAPRPCHVVQAFRPRRTRAGRVDPRRHRAAGLPRHSRFT